MPDQNTTEPETTEAIREAAWKLVDLLEYGQARWTKIELEIAWSGPTLRRAAAALGRVGVVAFDRQTGMWSRVEEVEVPASLWPRHALIEAVASMQAEKQSAERVVDPREAERVPSQASDACPNRLCPTSAIGSAGSSERASAT